MSLPIRVDAYSGYIANEHPRQFTLDGDELLVRPSITLVTVDADVVRRAEKLIESCEHCHPDDAEILFDWILDRVTGRSGSTTDCILVESARCQL